VVFGSSGYFANSEIKIERSEAMSIGSWYAKDAYSVAYFDEGKFLYVTAGVIGATSISADCDKF